MSGTVNFNFGLGTSEQPDTNPRVQNQLVALMAGAVRSQYQLLPANGPVVGSFSSVPSGVYTVVCQAVDGSQNPIGPAVTTDPVTVVVTIPQPVPTSGSASAA